MGSKYSRGHHYEQLRADLAETVRTRLAQQGTTPTEFARRHYKNLNLSEHRGIRYMSAITNGTPTNLSVKIGKGKADRGFSPREIDRASILLRLLGYGPSDPFIELFQREIPEFHYSVLA